MPKTRILVPWQTEPAPTPSRYGSGPGSGFGTHAPRLASIMAPLIRVLHAGRILLALVLVLAFAPSNASAQVVRDTFFVTNGPVYATALYLNTLYIGGSFTQVGSATGGGVPLEAATGILPYGFSKIVGKVYAVVADGAGGWYVGGTFTAVRGIARSNLAHILPDNTVAAWNPAPNDTVRALARSGTKLYVGGTFTSIGGLARSRIAALDLVNGLATPWNPNSNNTVRALAISDSLVYAGGSFTSIGGQTRNRIAALDTTTGSASAWNPNANNRVLALDVRGGTVYAGGDFGSIGTKTRSRIAALAAASGLATSWNPKALGGSVFALKIQGSRVYAGGDFTEIGGQARNRIAALDDTAGLAIAWNPNADGTVNALATNGALVYAGGGFAQVGGRMRSHVAVLDSSSALADSSWNPNVNNTVRALALGSGLIYVGGDFSGITGIPRNNIAALDATTGIVTNWAPNAGSSVRALVTNGATVYAGGDFTSIGGQIRNRIAALDTMGLATAWNPNANSTVFALGLDTGVVYAGGGFTNIGGQARGRIAALSTATGLSTSWNPNSDSTVFALAVSGVNVCAGGAFTAIGGQPRNRIAALSSSTGFATSWNPNANATVFAVTSDAGTVYAGGDFTSIGGAGRNHIAALEDTAGQATAWNPNANSGVRTVVVAGNTVYAGGAFTSMGGQSRSRIAAVDVATATATAWNPNAVDTVATLAVGGSSVYAGGSFTIIGGLPQTFLAAIVASCPAPGEVGSASTTLAGPQASATGDFDGDGLLDVAVAVSTGAQVLRNLGDGRFSSLATISLGTTGRGIASGDFNGDAVLDLALSTSTNLYVMRGLSTNGIPSGGFGAPSSYAVGGANPAGIAVADFNQDGINDLAVVVTGAGKIAVLLGQGSLGVGDGAFHLDASYTVGSSPLVPALADFNDDGIWDLAVSNSGGTNLSVLFGGNTGGIANGTFGTATSYPAGGTPGPIAIGDFNEDGITDLALGISAPNAASVLLGNGANGIGIGTFATAVQYPVGGSFSGVVRDLEVADFDSDGRADLAAVLDNGLIQYVPGDGSGVTGSGSFLPGSAASVGGALSSLQFNAFDPLAGAPTPIVAQSDISQIVSVNGTCPGGIGRTLEMISPNGGESVTLGSSVPILWRPGDLVIAVHVEVSRDDGAHWQRLASNQTGSQFQWRVAPPGTPLGRVRVVDANMTSLNDASNGSFTIQPLVDVPAAALPARPSFSLAYPNPSHGEVWFDLRLPAAAVATVEVFDLAGRRVHTLARGLQTPGEHALVWDGRESSGGRAAAGIYFVRARLPGFGAVRRVARIE